MTPWYDKAGNPIADIKKVEPLLSNMDYKRVRETTLPDGKWVSTIWIGLDYNYGDGPPLIFETMVFSSREEMGGLECRRYATEAEAIAGHEEMCREQEKIRDREEQDQGLEGRR